ncbi:MAG: hypothetical protein IPL65_04460 [Lewinellaceae bacterium]|nr:hypothetical protein [Lewinellaceae bacterium]
MSAVTIQGSARLATCKDQTFDLKNYCQSEYFFSKYMLPDKNGKFYGRPLSLYGKSYISKEHAGNAIPCPWFNFFLISCTNCLTRFSTIFQTTIGLDGVKLEVKWFAKIIAQLSVLMARHKTQTMQRIDEYL